MKKEIKKTTEKYLTEKTFGLSYYKRISSLDVRVEKLEIK